MRFISTDWGGGGGGENYILIVLISVQINKKN